MSLAVSADAAAAGPGWWDWVGLALTILGFLFAGVQLARVTSASKAASEALREARSDVMKQQLAALAFHLSHVVHDLSFAMETNNTAVAHRALLRFSSIAEEIAPLVRDGETPNGELAQDLLEASEEALNVKERLIAGRNKTVDVVRDVKKIDTSISILVKKVTGFQATARYTPGGKSSV